MCLYLLNVVVSVSVQCFQCRVLFDDVSVAIYVASNFVSIFLGVVRVYSQQCVLLCCVCVVVYVVCVHVVSV